MIRNKIFILLGPPGSGKGTLSELCIKKFGWIQLSTGNLCREHIAQKTELGVKIAEIIAQGGLVSDDIIADLVADWLLHQSSLPSGILFDGYPRTARQASLFYDLLQSKLTSFDVILVKLDVDRDILLQRVLNRVICSNKNCGRVYSLMSAGETSPKHSMVCDSCGSPLIRRADDTLESLQNRLDLYFQHEHEIIEFYREKGFPVYVLNGAQEISKVMQDFNSMVLSHYDY